MNSAAFLLDKPVARVVPPTLGPVQQGLHALQCDVLVAVASGQPLDRVADILCRHVERLAPSVACSVLSIDEGGRLRSLAGPSLPEAFSRAIDGLAIGPEVGSCGTAAYLGHPVEVLDIGRDPRWAAYRELPIAAGFRACWSSPIKARDDRVIGTFAFYFRTARAPNALERQIVETSIHLCALALEHEKVRTRLEQMNGRFEAALSNMCQGLCFFDSDQRLIVANQRYSEIYDLPAEQIRPGILLREIVALRIAHGSGPVMPVHDYLTWRDTIQSVTIPTETIVELTNGRVIAIQHRPLADSGWVSTHEDITERRRAEERILFMARHDALTGLPNRVFFLERIDEALARSARGQHFAILCLDLDHFKAVNDTFGHPVGDRLLQAVAERLHLCVREGDTITRLGGDEFAILLSGMGRPERASELAQRIVHRLSEPYDLDGRTIVVSVSIGIALAPEDGTSPDRLLKSADIALYRAKADQGAAYRFFEADMDARLQARLALEADLRQALANDQFLLFYQPMIDLRSNVVCGFEALLRWCHPTRGLVAPAEFIALAEETGLIVPIGDWVLRRSCLEAARWPHGIKLAVNLSAAQFKGQFKGKLLAESVREALAASGLPAAMLELEITETVLLANSADTLATLHQLRSLGVRISMDDFGTGYSSLSYLRSFPFDKIKIDQSFIRDLSDREDSVAIVRAVVGLGKSLGMTTTAEGVEAPDQLARLREEGCGEVQGYLFSRPRPPAEIPMLLRLDLLAEHGALSGA